ncbi:hypothetical protein [Planktotalea arctica]|uniref:hypothetical protein n=1 Tax=Planktotalea arctica TaxID=1481893 RepID=UPI00321A6C1A
MSHDDDLAEMFEEARRAPPPAPSADFLARVLSEGQAMQPAPAAPAAKMRARQKWRSASLKRLFAGLGEAIGGWPAFAGLASAAAAGLYIGISPPQGLILPLGAALGGDAAALTQVFEVGDGFDFTQFEG